MVTKKINPLDELEMEAEAANIDYSTFGDRNKLYYMNQRHAMIESVGAKPMVLCYTYSPIFNKDIIEFRTPEAIEKYYLNNTIEVNGKVIPLGAWWLRHAERREYNCIVFDPTQPREFEHKSGIEHRDYKILNMWEGLNVIPIRGSWRRTKRHIWRVLANKNKEKFKYIIKWFAWMLQNPGERAEVAIVLKGKEGAGKGFIFTQFVEIFGKHSMHISSRDHLTGKFNGHLRALVFLFADEAYYPGDKEVEGALKQLITEPVLTIEAKFKEPATDKNRLHICMATNNEWVIPASADSRRYFINEVDNMYAKNKCANSIREKYFDLLWSEMKYGGKAAMTYDLLKVKLGGWHPRNEVPETEELKKQALMSLPRSHKAILSMLQDGQFPGEQYENGACYIQAKILWAYMEELEPGTMKISHMVKSELIKELGCYKNSKTHAWNFPDLQTMRSNWDLRHGVVKWDKVITEWSVIKSPY